MSQDTTTPRPLTALDELLDPADLTPIETTVRGRAAASARHIAAALRAGLCPDDRLFDRFLPDDLHLASRQHWTPLGVVLRIARWLDAHAIDTVVDLGSGAGKFCVAAALASRARFTGIEQRPRLVDAARSLAGIFGVADRVHFRTGTIGCCPLPPAAAYYLFNPFGENLFDPHERIDTDVELTEARYRRDVATLQHLLAAAPAGTCVVKYNGFGAAMPPGYQRIAVDRELPELLRMWRKTATSRS
jgi:predicted RNA methylase